jgi:hypothetical protein
MRVVHSRLQHGVGQGSFHSASVEVSEVSGTRYRFDYVYDCGALVGSKASPHLLNAIKRMDLSRRVDSDRAVIDALVLSHFDRDHIVGAELLVKKFFVRRIYVPYLSPMKLALVLAGQETPLDEFYVRELHGLANGTALLFEVPVTMVQSGGDGGNDGPPQNPVAPEPSSSDETPGDEEVLPTSLQAVDGQTGQPVGALMSTLHEVGLGVAGLPGPVPWILRFWNRGLDSRLIDHLQQELSVVGFPLAALSRARDAGEIVDWLDPSTNRQAALNAYRKAISAYNPSWGAEASGQRLANFLSMCMYSGPAASQFRADRYQVLHSSDKGHCCSPTCWLWKDGPLWLAQAVGRVGWLGTGDAPLGEPQIWTDFSAHYATALGQTLTVQVPHDGAAPIRGPKFFNPDLIQTPGMNAVVSVGSTNSYGHPRAGVLKDALAKGASLAVVTEHQWLGFHEVIDLRIP